MTKKEGIFDKLKPEDICFGDSLGEGEYQSLQEQLIYCANCLT